jgi:hypothetical protein
MVKYKPSLCFAVSGRWYQLIISGLTRELEGADTISVIEVDEIINISGRGAQVGEAPGKGTLEFCPLPSGHTKRPYVIEVSRGPLDILCFATNAT